MRCRCSAIPQLALVFALSFSLMKTRADAADSPSLRTSGGWRPARSSARSDHVPTSFSTVSPVSRVVAAQSPDDGRYDQPTWRYPSKQQSNYRSTVGVPAYRSPTRVAETESARPVAGRRIAQDWRSAGPNSAPIDPPMVEESESPMAGDSFHSSPFEPSGPTCPVPSSSVPPPPPSLCAPSSGFGDACLTPELTGNDYTWNNLYVFALVEAFEQSDSDDERLAGRFGFNWALPAFDDHSGLAWQGGFSGSVAEEGSQFFATGGLFYRGDMRDGAAWNGGAVFDWMQDDAFDTDVAQVRAKTSITLDAKNEVGVWGAASVMHDDKRGSREIEPVDQANLFYRYLFNNSWDLTGWVGWRSKPNSLAIGGDLSVPLSESWALTGGGHYTFEGDSWDAYAGVAWFWGRHARQQLIGQHRHQPYLPVANNGSMTLFLDQ